MRATFAPVDEAEPARAVFCGGMRRDTRNQKNPSPSSPAPCLVLRALSADVAHLDLVAVRRDGAELGVAVLARAPRGRQRGAQRFVVAVAGAEDGPQVEAARREEARV